MKRDLKCPKCGSTGTDLQSETVRGEGRRHWCLKCNYGSWRISDFYVKETNTFGRERRDIAIGYLNSGWCPWPHLRVPPPGTVGVDKKAQCRCGKWVKVTARGLYAHHKPHNRVRLEDLT